MANAEDVDIASQHNVFEPKAVEADGHNAGRDSVDGNISINSPACERFSLRGYVATIRTLDRSICWPFPQHLLETRMKESGGLALPSLEIPNYRWWNCESCLGDVITSAESVIEKDNMRDSNADANFDSQCLMLLPTSNADIQGKQKENMLNDTEIIENIAVDLKSGDVVGSPYDNDKEKKDDVATDCIRKPGKNEILVRIEQENEVTDLEEKKSEIPYCLSNFKNIEETINIIDSNENVQSAETTQRAVETTAQMLVTKANEELELKQKKSELHIPCQVPKSWEDFSRNKNVFKEISENMKRKDVEQASSPILGSENSTDASKLTNINIVPIHSMSAENVELCQLVVLEGKDEKTISNGVEQLTGQMMDFIVPNEHDPHRSSDAGNDVPCLNGNDSSCSQHTDINEITEVKESTEHSNSEALLEKENVLLSCQIGKLKTADSSSKRKPQKKRSIADIIASKPFHLECWNRGIEDSKFTNQMDKKMCMTENNEQSPYPKEDCLKVTVNTVQNSSKATASTNGIPEVNIVAETNKVNAVKNSSKPTNGNNGISEFNIAAEMNNVRIKKERSKKLKVKRKPLNIGIAFSDAFVKSSSASSSSQAVVNALQMPQGISLFASASRDKSPERNFLNPEHGKIGQKLSEMGDEIPMDIVELMAKNQHDRGLSNLNHFDDCDNSKKGRRRLKMKETDLNQVNKHIERGTGRKKKTAIPKSKAQPKETGKSKLQTPVRYDCQSDLRVHYAQINPFQGVRDNSFFPDKEGTASGSCKGDLAVLQSNHCFNPERKISPDLAAPVLDETVSASNLTFPIDGSKSHASSTHSYRNGDFSSNKMAEDSMELRDKSTYCGHMQVQNLCRESTPTLSDFTGSGIPIFRNKSDSSLSSHGCSHQKLTRTDSPQNMNSESSGLGNSCKKFDIPSESHKGNSIYNFPVRADGSSGPLYFSGQGNSVLLQPVNVQAGQPSREKDCFPSAPVFRLMGQCVSVRAKCGNEEKIATDNGDRTRFTNLPEAYSRNSCFHSSGVMERSQRETFSGTERVLKSLEPIQDSKNKNEKFTNSIKAIPPVPKFRPSGNYASNGNSEVFTPSSAIPGNANVALGASMLRTKSPFQGTLISGKILNRELHCTDGYNGNLNNFSTPPPACQTTNVVKGLRSHKAKPTAMHLNRKHRSAPDIYLDGRHHCFQSPWVLGSNPHQNLTKEAEKAKSLELHKENEESGFYGKNASNVEICILNQNPAEINVDVEEDKYSFGHDHLNLSHSDLAHSERKREMTIPQAQKRRRTSKSHIREFLNEKDGYVGHPARTNVDSLVSLGRELVSVKELVGNIT